MRRMLLVLTVAALMVAVMASSAMPAFAADLLKPPKEIKIKPIKPPKEIKIKPIKPIKPPKEIKIKPI